MLNNKCKFVASNSHVTSAICIKAEKCLALSQIVGAILGMLKQSTKLTPEQLASIAKVLTEKPAAH